MFDIAALGREVDAFWRSHMGAYLLKRADAEYVEALTALKTWDATDATSILRLQSEIWRAESFRAWLSKAITDGLTAEANLEDRDEDT